MVSVMVLNWSSSLDQLTAGFFRSISLRNEEALQDTLRLLTLWFKYGSHDEVSHAMGNGFTAVEVDTWLEVIPQVFLYFVVFTDADQMIRLSHGFKRLMPISDEISTIFWPKLENTIHKH